MADGKVRRRHARDEGGPADHSSPIQTCTVGTGIAPVPPCDAGFADFHRRSGLRPSPEESDLAILLSIRHVRVKGDATGLLLHPCERIHVARILTLDLGTSSIKAAIFRTGEHRPEWTRRQPLLEEVHSLASWESERWVHAVQSTCDQIDGAGSLDAVAMSGNGPTVVPVGRDGPVDQALLWVDSREWRIPGKPSFFLPKIAWFREYKPAVYDQTWQFMTCPEYLGYVLTGVPHSTSPSTEFDPYIWDEPGIAAYGIDPEKLPPLVRPGDHVGDLTGRAHDMFGLPAGIPVFAGGPDFLMSLLGTATTRPGCTCDRAGTSEGINHCAPAQVTSNDVRCLPHVISGLYNVAGVLSSTGRIFEWFRRISRQRSVAYERMLAEIAAAGYDTEPLFFPSMHKGAAWEFASGMFVGLRSDHATAEMGRGVVHAIGYAVRQSIESLIRAGCEVRELTACGGQARNDIWNRMKADITGMPIRCPLVLDAELTGDYCCALLGLGEYDSLLEASEDTVRFGPAIEPDEKSHERFSEGYAHYLDTYERYVTALHPVVSAGR
jgi:xylulokinase